MSPMVEARRSAFVLPGIFVVSLLSATLGAVDAAETGGGGAAPTAWPGTPDDAWDVKVVMKDTAFHPKVLVVPPGTTVTWVNRESGVPHDVQGDPPGKVPAFDSGDVGALEEGATWSFTFHETGNFDYFCELHTKGVMSGKVIVSADGAPPAGAGAGAGGHAVDPNASATESGFVSITKVGVTYFAYWIGLLAFVVVIVTLIFLFFFLKYGESAHASDQTAREAVPVGAGPGLGEGPVESNETVVATVGLLIALAVVWWLLQRLAPAGG